MTISIIIFIISLLIVFGILLSSAHQVRRGQRQVDGIWAPDVSFRKIEKYVLYYTKNIVQITVVTVVKYSMIGAIKTKKIVREKWPHVHTKVKKILSKKENVDGKPSFIQKAILESKTKIRRIKDKVKRDHQ
jgi:beta-xylosidase